MGVSNYHHKLLSHLLTHYGMDKKTGNARHLRELINRLVPHVSYEISCLLSLDSPIRSVLSEMCKETNFTLDCFEVHRKPIILPHKFMNVSHPAKKLVCYLKFQ